MKESNTQLQVTAKQAAGRAAADLIESGMVVGLGTGSTSLFFIEALAARCREGLKVVAVATSKQSAEHAAQLGIPIKDPNDILILDVTVDGADEIDPAKNMIKGGGGALFREKMLAQASREMIVIVDETKLVDRLGTHPLPIEILPFAYPTIIKRVQEQGYDGNLRLKEDRLPFVTDNGNYIFDISNKGPILNPKEEQERLKRITGVLETGLFFDIAKRVVIGYHDGLVKIRT